MNLSKGITNKNSTPLYSSLTRLQGFPLDTDSVKQNEEELFKYLEKGSNAYVGQIITVLDEKKTYIIRTLDTESPNEALLEIADNEKIFDEIERIDSAIETANASIVSVKNSLDSYITTNDEIVGKLKNDLENETLFSKKLEADLGALKGIVSGHTETLISHANEIETLKNTDLTLKGNIENLNNDLANAVSELKAADLAINTRIDALKSEVAEMNTELKEAIETRIKAIEDWKAEAIETLKTFMTKSEIQTFVSSSISDAISNYYTKEQINQKILQIEGSLQDYATTDYVTNQINSIQEKLTAIYRYKGSVPTADDLPMDGNEKGDVYNTEETGMNYAWDGSAWDPLGANTMDVDLSNYYTKEEVNKLIDEKITSGDIDLANYYTKTQADEKFVSFTTKNLIFEGGTASKISN